MKILCDFVCIYVCIICFKLIFVETQIDIVICWLICMAFVYFFHFCRRDSVKDCPLERKILLLKTWTLSIRNNLCMAVFPMPTSSSTKRPIKHCNMCSVCVLLSFLSFIVVCILKVMSYSHKRSAIHRTEYQ